MTINKNKLKRERNTMSTTITNKTILTTPIGVSEPYSYLNKPDYGNSTFKNERGVYKVSVTFPTEKVQSIMNTIVSFHNEDYKSRLEQQQVATPVVRGKRSPVEPYKGDLPFFNNTDATTTFNFKCYGSFIDRITGLPKPIILPIVDSQGKRLSTVPIIGEGSHLKVRFSLVPYGWSKVTGASVKLQLVAVMIVKLVPYVKKENSIEDWTGETEPNGYTDTVELDKLSNPDF